MNVTELFWASVPFVIVACVLAGTGHAIALVIGDGPNSWVRFWHRTRALHPICAGAVMGLLDLPVAEQMGSSLASRVLWFTCAGIFSAFIYEGVKKAIEKRLQ